MNQMSKIQINEVAKSKYERVLKRSTSTAVLVLFAQGLSGCFRNDGTIDGPSISGVAFDGPLSRAKVFVDANNNNLLDGSEDWTWTNSDGSFTLSTNAEGPLVVVGTSETTDAFAPDAKFDGLTLTAPEGSSVISPATTVAKNIADAAIAAAELAAGGPLTDEQIQEQIDLAYEQTATVFGISGDAESLATFNPFIGDTTSEDATAYKKAAAKIVAASNAVATAAAANGAEKGDAMIDALGEIANQALAQLDDDPTAVLVIDVSEVANAVETGAGVVIDATLKNNLSEVVAKLSTQIDLLEDVSVESASTLLYASQSLLVDAIADQSVMDFLVNSDDIASDAARFIRVTGDTTAEMSEDNELGESEAHTVSGTLSITDPNEADETTYKFDTRDAEFLGAGEALGKLSITSEGVWTYTVTDEILSQYNYLQAAENRGAVKEANGPANEVNFSITEQFKVLITEEDGTPVYIDDTQTVQASKIITVKIVGENDAPTLVTDFSTPADLTIAQGLDLEEDAVATIDFSGAFEDADTADVLTFSEEGLPPGLTIDPVTGVVSGAPSSSAFGEYTVTVSVTDAGGEEVSAASFKITVTNTNDAPAVTEEAVSIAATEDTALSYDASALFSDPDIANGHDETDALTYTLESPVEWLSIDASTGALSGTPDNNDVRTEAFTIKVTATDNYGETALKEISVSVENTNDAPVATTADLGILSDTASRTITIADLAGSVTDVDVGDEIVLKSLTLQDGSGSVKDNDDNTFTYTPIDGETGDDITFAYTVSDKAGETDSSTATLSVVDAIPVGSGSEDAPAITIAVSDLPGATITVADDDLANKGTISEDGTTFEPLSNWYGTVSFNVLTADGVTLPGVLEVSAVNDAPVINLETTDTSLVVLDDGGSVTGTIIASDVETTDLTYSATGAEKGSVTFTEGGNYTYTATAGQEGSDSFTITVSDGTATDDQEQVVTVQIGAISVGSGSEDATEITIAASDLPGATITVADDDLSNKGTISEDGTTFTPLPDWSGTVDFNVLTADGETLPGVLVVSSVNDAPVIGTSDTALTTDEDTAVTGTINATDVETSAANLTYEASVAPKKGSVTFTDGGNYTYTPNADVNGTDTFTVTVSDGDKSVTEDVTVTINPVNDVSTFLDVGYQWVAEKMTYDAARDNATSSGGFLIDINNADEQADMVTLTADMYAENSSAEIWGTAADGGGISYIWLGASDADTEGTWVWESGRAFEYTAWGTEEPDNYNGDQDGLALGLTNWPLGAENASAYGLAGQWNDIAKSNSLTSLVQYNDTSANTAVIGIKEGAASANSIIYMTAADDVDSDAITLTLGGTDAAAFTIDSSGDGIGIVRLKEAADYETKTSYSFEVIAEEGGETTSKAVTLNVVDVVEPAVLSANLSSDGNDHTVVLSLDATALSNSEFVSIEGFTLAFAGSGGPTSSDGITSDLFGNFASFSTTSREDLSNAGLSKYNTAGSFNSDIFGSEATWSLSGGDAVALASDDPVYEVTINGSPIDITQYIGTNFDIGTLRFTTSDDVTDLDIIVSGSVTGNNVDNSLNSTTGLLSEALTPITIDVI